LGEIFEKVGCPEPIGMVFGFEKLLGQCDEGLGHGGIFSFLKPDGVVKSLHLLCYSVWPYAQHTICMPSRMTKHYALYMKIFT